MSVYQYHVGLCYALVLMLVYIYAVASLKVHIPQQKLSLSIVSTSIISRTLQMHCIVQLLSEIWRNASTLCLPSLIMKFDGVPSIWGLKVKWGGFWRCGVISRKRCEIKLRLQY